MGATFQQDERMMALLQRPEQAYLLAGVWDAKMTKSVPESPTRVWNPDPGMTEGAKSLVGRQCSRHGLGKGEAARLHGKLRPRMAR
jgi:hypothetical protein